MQSLLWRSVHLGGERGVVVEREMGNKDGSENPQVVKHLVQTAATECALAETVATLRNNVSRVRS